MTTAQINELKSLRARTTFTIAQATRLEKLTQMELKETLAREEQIAAAARRAEERQRRAEEEEQKRAEHAERLVTVVRGYAVRGEWSSLRGVVAGIWLKAHEIIANFASSKALLAYPDYTLSWAEDVMVASATRSILDGLFIRHHSEEEFNAQVDGLLNSLSNSMLDNAWDEGSSGFMHRAMQNARRTAASRIYRELKGARTHFSGVNSAPATGNTTA